jgi:hypothetical protein
MTTEQVAEIGQLQARIRALAGDSESKAVIDGDEESGVLVANEAGALRLASLLLDCARGEDVKAPDWLECSSWVLEGFQRREQPEIVLPTIKPSLQYSALAAALTAIALVFLGFIDGVHRAWEWLMRVPR